MTQIEIFKQKFEKMVDNIPASIDSAGYVIDEVYKILDSLNNTEFSGDLGEEVKRYWNEHALEYRIGRIADIDFLHLTAYHFAEWSEEQMMKKAVEGRYMKAASSVYAESWPLDIDPNSVKAGDEVSLIVIPKEK